MKTENQKQQTIYFPIDIYEKLEEIASKEGRSINNLVNRIVVEKLDKPINPEAK